MDYVVAGFGIGAILALIGFALWELFGNAEEPGAGWPSRAAIGLMLGSLVIWAVTGVSLISHIEDSMGSQLVLLTTLVTLISVAGGSFWYWRADRALAATRPRPADVSAKREGIAAGAPPAAIGDIELAEWDSWPERDAGKPAEPEGEPVEPAPSFEPEVAVAVPEADDVETDTSGTVEADDLVVEVVEVEKVEEGEEPVSLSEDEEVKEPVEAAADTVEPEAELPANIRPFRAPAKPVAEPSEQVVEEDLLIAETVDVERVAVQEEAEVPPIVVEESEIVAVVEDEEPASVDGSDTDVVDEAEQPNPEPEEKSKAVPAVANGSDPPAGFESSLLADIDGSLVEDDGAYRSPLLSDLGSDKLKGVGLAKWRPDAPLTDQDEEELTPPAKSGGRR